MKKLVMIMFALVCMLAAMALPARAASLNFDFNDDGVYDPEWTLDPPPVGKTVNVKVWLDGWDQDPWAAEPLFSVQAYFYFDTARLQVNSITPNDSDHGGPFDKAFSLIELEEVGKYKISVSNFTCVAITQKILLCTIQLQATATGNAAIEIRTDFDAGAGAIFPGGPGCSAPDFQDALPAAAVIHQNECQSDEECWNSTWCDGIETCVDGACVAGAPPCTGDNNTCTATCIEGAPPAESNPGSCNVCSATGTSDPCCLDPVCAGEQVCTVVINDYYVNAAEGSNANDGLTPASAWKTITHALSQVAGTENARAVINVAPGVYDSVMGGGDAESFPLNMENYVALQGAGYKTTIIDAGQAAGVMRCFIVNDVAIEGFTLQNGWAVRGGGIFMYHCSAIAVTGCRITANTAFGTDGGGIFARGTSPAITNCLIADNTAAEYGGGIACYEQSDATITNCTIVNNEALDVIQEGGGGGACNNESSPVVMNSILWNNLPNEVLLVDPLSSITISYSVVTGGYAGIGNTSADPRFLGPEDYRPIFGSSCIDAANSTGAPLADIDGNARFNDPTVPNTGAGPITYYDIGAYEFTGDSDQDGIPDDGDQSGAAGDNPCANGATENCDDNCLAVPNGPDLGTCTAGSVGDECLSDADCGPGGSCSLAQDDVDADGVGDACDNCAVSPNGPVLGSCAQAVFGIYVSNGADCTSNAGCTNGRVCVLTQQDTNGNGTGDVCECNADFDGNCRVDALDVLTMKNEFGRADCNINPCQSDITGDGRVNAFDLLILKYEYGRADCEPCSTP